MKLLTVPIAKQAIEELRRNSGSYVKVTADLAKEVLVAGGELHADGEKILLEKGSRQDDIWGGGINLDTKEIDTTAVLNLRPRLNNTGLEIADPKTREKFITIVKRIFDVLWD